MIQTQGAIEEIQRIEQKFGPPKVVCTGGAVMKWHYFELPDKSRNGRDERLIK